MGTRSRGFTLIELMIAVAILGIFASASTAAFSAPSRDATDLVLRERAAQVLDYEADVLLHGKRPDEAVEHALLAELPESSLNVIDDHGLARIEISWKSAGRKHDQRAVTVARPQ